jgi:hypothetical protein
MMSSSPCNSGVSMRENEAIGKIMLMMSMKYC